MDPAGCANVPNCRTRAITCFCRALRSVIGMIIVAGVATMLISILSGCDYDIRGYFQEDKFNVKYERLRIELEKLKHRKTEFPHPSSSETEIGDACFSERQLDCESQEKEIRDGIRKELSLYHADKTGMPDFALENLGGCILTTRDTENYYAEGSSYLKVFSKPDTSNRILQPDITLGNCWAFRGHQGTAVIKLIAFVFITHVTVEHISPKMSPSGDIASAPKKFTLWGLKDPNDSFGKHKFGSFEYKKGGRLVQIFPVQHPIRKAFRVVEVTFHDNHGNSEYTCVYRVRIHGNMDKSEGKLNEKPPS